MDAVSLGVKVWTWSKMKPVCFRLETCGLSGFQFHLSLHGEHQCQPWSLGKNFLCFCDHFTICSYFPQDWIIRGVTGVRRSGFYL